MPGPNGDNRTAASVETPVARVEGPGLAAESSSKVLRSFLLALPLGLLGLGLNALPLRLLESHASGWLLGGAPVLLAFVLLGTGPGLVAGLLALGFGLVPPANVSGVSGILYLVEAWGASWVYRRQGSLIFSVAVYWGAVGWLLALALQAGALGLDRHDLALLLVGQVLGGLMNAVVAEAVLVLTGWHPLDAIDPRSPEDLRRFLLTRATLLAAAPAVALALTVTGEVSGSPASLYAILLLMLGSVFLLRATLSRFALRLATPLQAIDRAIAALGEEGFREALGSHPIAEVRDLTSRLTKMYSDLAYHDALTDLPNRKLLLDRLNLAVAQAMRSKEGMALLHVDLDRFRVIDHSLGRPVSNAVLKQIAGRLLECVRPGDTVARVGDDEFALLMPRMRDMDEAVKTAQRVMDSIKRAVLIEGREVFLTASVGISLYPRDGNDADTLLKNAHAATLLAKEGGQDTYRRYTARISAKDTKRLMIETAVRGALSREEMVLHYQPQLDLATGRIEGMEALVRCPVQGAALMSPGDFIPVAEGSDLIVEIGLWVLKTACAQMRAWQQKGYRVRVAVNLSARQLQQPDILSQVLRALEVSGLDPAILELEITESAAMQDMERSVETLKALREHGVSISMDDFGTGYSSLSYLRKLPVDRVKLDQAFVREIKPDTKDAAIAVAVIALAHSLRLKVVAEGVETEEQLAFLRGHGCDAMQGYLFSPPVPSEEFEKLLEQGRKLEFQ